MIKKKFLFIALVILIVGIIVFLRFKNQSTVQEHFKEIIPTIGSIRNIVSTTATVLPKNRLEIKPPVNGRIESVLVKEGEQVKIGQLLAWMSSTERAALIDAARGQGPEALAYWEEAYKPIALLAPIDGEVIVATTQPGQTVTTSDAVVVLSDNLIVRAQVDETDIGKINLNQKAIITLDAYPDIQINGHVDHIYYESETVNNVTIYKVDLVPEEVPVFFRSGMNTNVDFIESTKDNCLLLPVGSVYKDQDGDYVFVPGGGGSPVKRRVTLGISDDENVEILSGISKNEKIIVKTSKFVLPQKEEGANPFFPSRSRSSTTKK